MTSFDLFRRGWAAGERDPRPAPQPPRMIPSGASFPELCMLASDLGPDGLESLHPMGTKRLVQLKADGIRALYIDGRIVTREGTPLDCALHCQPALRRLEKSFGEPMVIDGEYVEAAGFNATIAAHRRGDGTGVFWAFDLLPYQNWLGGGWTKPADQRLMLLRNHFSTDSPFLGMLCAWELDAAETLDRARTLWAEGYEGVVSKRIDSPYIRARSPDWRRLKQRITHQAPIIDTFIKDGRLKHVIVQGVQPDGPPITVGTGWNEIAAKAIMINAKMGYPMSAEVSFELTTGVKRTIRGAAFDRLIVEGSGE